MARSWLRIRRVVMIAPTAKTPTAIESTTSAVRALLRARSRSTLRQRGGSVASGLGIDGLPQRSALTRPAGGLSQGERRVNPLSLWERVGVRAPIYNLVHDPPIGH